jgi:hypothetical protein
MIYDKGIKAKDKELKLKNKQIKITKMSSFEFKMLMDLYKESAKKLQSTKLGDYIDPYYDDPEEESRIELGRIFHIRKIEREVLEVRRRSLACLGKSKEELAPADVGKKNAKLTQMLNGSNRIKYNGQSFDYFLDVIKNKQKKTISKIKKHSDNMRQKVGKLKNKILYTQVKTRQVNLIGKYPKSHKSRDGRKSTAKPVKTAKQWVAITDIKRSIEQKEELLKWLRKENKVYDTKNQQLTTRVSDVKILSPNMKIRIFKEQPRKSVIYLDKRFNLVKTRYMDYSLGIGSISSSTKSYSSIGNPKLYASPAYSSKSIETFASASTRVKTPYVSLERKLKSMKE